MISRKMVSKHSGNGIRRSSVKYLVKNLPSFSVHSIIQKFSQKCTSGYPRKNSELLSRSNFSYINYGWDHQIIRRLSDRLIMGPLDFSNEPKDRPKTLHVHQSEPFNAEPEDLTEFINHYITPSHLTFKRNHGPIPDIKEEEYTLTVTGLVNHPLKLTFLDLKSMPKTDVVSALQVCSQKRST
jgi:hypothetical protein